MRSAEAPKSYLKAPEPFGKLSKTSYQDLLDSYPYHFEVYFRYRYINSQKPMPVLIQIHEEYSSRICVVLEAVRQHWQPRGRRMNAARSSGPAERGAGEDPLRKSSSSLGSGRPAGPNRRVYTHTYIYIYIHVCVLYLHI